VIQQSCTRRALWLDAALGVAFAVAVSLITTRIDSDDPGSRSLDFVAYALIAVAGLSLAVRRRFPIGVLAVTTAAVLVYTVRDYSGGPVYLSPVIAMFTVGQSYERRRWIPAVLTSALVITVVGVIGADGDNGSGWFHAVYSSWAVAAGFLGDAARNRRQYLLGLEERARYLEESRDEESRRVVAEERLRIARDLHDVVAHSLASINIQAGAGAHVAPEHPDQAQAALAAIKTASKEALDELRLTLGVLRSGEEGAPRAPVPTLARLDGLVERTRAAGLPVEVAVVGAPDAIPAAVDAAAFRIVQESLTNALRHAGPAARATVSIAYGDDAVEIEVVDDGLGSTALNGTPGHGIAGMRERAAGLGGTLSAGALPGGGFRVHATLPARAEVGS
jgi:signal transduction histidine kinase